MAVLFLEVVWNTFTVLRVLSVKSKSIIKYSTKKYVGRLWKKEEKIFWLLLIINSLSGSLPVTVRKWEDNHHHNNKQEQQFKRSCVPRTWWEKRVQTSSRASFPTALSTVIRSYLTHTPPVRSLRVRLAPKGLAQALVFSAGCFGRTPLEETFRAVRLYLSRQPPAGALARTHASTDVRTTKNYSSPTV